MGQLSCRPHSHTPTTPQYPGEWRRNSRYGGDAAFKKNLLRAVNTPEPIPVRLALFQSLLSEWRKGTAHQSLLSKKVMHPAYQRIIGIGPAAIPMILREMKVRPDHWFWALDALTQGKEKPAENCKNLDEVTEAWLAWGKAKNYL